MTTTIHHASASLIYLRGKPASTWIGALSQRGRTGTPTGTGGRASSRSLPASEHRS
jgi:hypothetical protein